MMKYLALLIIICFSLPSVAMAQAIPDLLPDPPCETTTCISIEAIAIAHHALVQQDPMPVELVELIWHHTPCGLGLSDATGIQILKQIPANIEHFGDTFCTIQGCTGNSLTHTDIRLHNVTTPLECVN